MLTLLAIVAVGYAGIVGAMYAFQRNLMYFPDVSLADIARSVYPGGVAVNVTTADGLTLAGWYWPPPQPRAPVVVVFHGNAGHHGHRTDKAVAFTQPGFGVFIAGYRGYGGNPGSPTEQGLYSDARAALDWLQAQGVAGGQIVLYGESLGSGVAVQMATERKVAAVVLESPYTSVADVAAERYPFVPVRPLTLDRYDSLSKIERINAPLLIIHGERDTVVPVKYGRRLFDAAREPKKAVFFPNAQHNDIFAAEAVRTVLQFLREDAGLSRSGRLRSSG
jgi:fermentation-respiration switch protein FrsA (DUF1100 family)